jgi:hypothetical protein
MRDFIKLSALIGTMLATSVALAQEQTPAQRDPNASTRSNTDVSSQSSEDGKTRTAQANDSGQRTGSNEAGGVAVIPFVTVLVPLDMENKADTSLASGCWAKLYGQDDFKGDTLTLVGPVDMSDMRGPFGVQWDDKVNSIKAGPQATVRIYDNANFKDKAATVRAGEQVQEISQKMGLFEDVESIRIRCNSAKSGG